MFIKFIFYRRLTLFLLKDQTKLFSFLIFHFNRNFFTPQGGPNLTASASLQDIRSGVHSLMPCASHMRQSRPVNNSG
jgi:hypothetical protein